jgi:predicted O-methyltransferase YrrM
MVQTRRISRALNVLRFSLNPINSQILLKKIFERVLEFGHDESIFAEKWARDNSIPLKPWLEALDSSLWGETFVATDLIRENCNSTIFKLEAEGIDLGGGGSLELLYFWTRKIRPSLILESGVAAGWSSYAFLLALKENGVGKLLSSDLPYFRIKNPQSFIGILVPKELRGSHWQLEIQGDDLNIPRLVSHKSKLQLIHYDSDKRKSGRRKFLSSIQRHLDDDCILIMDDIQNNLAFKEYVEYNNKVFTVIQSEGKYVGIALLGRYSKDSP